MKFDKSKAFTKRLASLVPGGAHTYSKGSDQFPECSGSGIVRGKGARLWDADGNCLIDWAMALMSVSLGHAHDEVNAAVKSAIDDGVNFSRPSALEMQAAEAILELTGDDMVKFARHGSVVTTAAVKLARAYTGRHIVAIPQEHPFFSFDDWFIGTTPTDYGVPEVLKQFTAKFKYNDLASLAELFDQHDGQVAAVILEPVKFDEPADGFLQGVRDLCTRHGAVLIFDEMITGLKFGLPGASTYFNVTPDIRTWGKGYANGFAFAAMTGRRDILDLGGIDRPNDRKLFLLSSTHGAESVGLAAMMKTIEIFRRDGLVASNWAVGEKLKRDLQDVISAHGLSEHLKLRGYPCFTVMDTFGPDGQSDDAFRTLLMQEMVARGILFQGLMFVTPSHGESELNQTIDAFNESCSVYVKALAQRGVEGLLQGPAIKPVFRRHV